MVVLYDEWGFCNDTWPFTELALGSAILAWTDLVSASMAFIEMSKDCLNDAEFVYIKFKWLSFILDKMSPIQRGFHHERRI